MQFAVLEDDATAPEAVEIGEYLDDAGDLDVLAGDVDGVGTEVDGDVETVFEEAEVFVASAVKRLDSGSDFKGLFDQSDS